MKKILIPLVLLVFFVIPVSAEEFTAPEVPQSGIAYMPEDTESFSDGLWYVIRTGLTVLQPSLVSACGTCLCLIGINLLIGLMEKFTGAATKTISLVGTIACATIMLQPANALIQLGVETVRVLSEYGKLLLPVMTGALAAQGGAVTGAALYTATAVVDAVLTTAIAKLLVPMVYIYLSLCIASNAIGEDMLKSLRDFVKWITTWCLKIILYVFTGYITITGVVSGATDATTLKAAKLAISGAVPVVGSILSDASEAVLVSAGVVKNAAGIYGLLAMAAVFIEPFLKIGVQYLLLKLTSAICTAIGSKTAAEMTKDFSGAMGLVLAMTGTVCLILLISTVCFMKGVG